MSNDELDLKSVRAAFPALASGFIYAENAGGSQVLGSVVDMMTDYLVHTNVQLGALYPVSQASTNRVNKGVEALKELFNAESTSEVMAGFSSTALVESLCRAWEGNVKEGNEIIITGEHETNAGPWKKLAVRRGAVTKLWTPSPLNPANPYSLCLQLPALLPLITSRTRVVALSACSNLLGTLTPIGEIVAAIREQAKQVGSEGLVVCVDCVAYAPHRRIDVRAWDIDFCVFSLYKLYGPHTGALYIRSTTQPSLAHTAHHFLPSTSISKIQLGGPGYEATYAATAIPVYIKSLTHAGTLDAGWAAIAKHEQKLLVPLLGYLRSKWDRGVRIVGDEKEGMTRVPTVSFVVLGEKKMRSKEVVDVFDATGKIGIRNGHMYAHTLVEGMEPGVTLEDGVVRISLVHYNTLEEVDEIIKVLDGVLAT